MLRLQVSTVQRSFVQKLLTFPVFSKHLAAVREINNMLRRALDLREACPGDERAAVPIKVDQPLQPHPLLNIQSASRTARQNAVKGFAEDSPHDMCRRHCAHANSPAVMKVPWHRM